GGTSGRFHRRGTGSPGAIRRASGTSMIVTERTGWLRLLFTVYGSTLPRTWPRLLFIAAVAEIVVLLNERLGLFDTALSVQPFSIMGIALGIFLGFRNNTCYDRWWEGRILW